MNEDYYGPIWIDPRAWGQYRKQRPPRRWGEWETTETVTRPVPAPVDEEKIRKIVREEMADLVQPDVPDAPPPDWNS